jgi:aspartate/methionine/tyrosine aminotransferase
VPSVADKFRTLATDNAPGQEVRQTSGNVHNLMQGGVLSGREVDFSHGDVDAFPPLAESLDRFAEAVQAGGRQAYTEYRGSADIRAQVALRLQTFIGIPVSSDAGLIVTSGTQGALFLAVASTVSTGDKVAIVQPDYFANRKLVEFFGGEVVPIKLDYLRETPGAGLDLSQLESAFDAGARTFVFSNPNNPTGTVYSAEEVGRISDLCKRFDVNVIVDQLYCRLRYEETTYTHICASGLPEEQVVTIMGPSKTESLSGYRLGVAFGAPSIIERMEKLQAIVSLRAAGYNQAVLRSWFAEPVGWMEQRIKEHQAIRDDIVRMFQAVGLITRSPEAGSYLFPTLPALKVSLVDFVRLLRFQANVIVTPGTEFGPHESSIRLNFSQDRSAAIAAAQRIVEMVSRYRA